MCVPIVAHAKFVVRSKLCFQYRVPATLFFFFQEITHFPRYFVPNAKFICATWTTMQPELAPFFFLSLVFLVDSNLIERWVWPPGQSVVARSPAAAFCCRIFTKCSIKKERSWIIMSLTLSRIMIFLVWQNSLVRTHTWWNWRGR